MKSNNKIENLFYYFKWSMKKIVLVLAWINYVIELYFFCCSLAGKVSGCCRKIAHTIQKCNEKTMNISMEWMRNGAESIYKYNITITQ